jgi:hypothetical protein
MVEGHIFLSFFVFLPSTCRNNDVNISTALVAVWQPIPKRFTFKKLFIETDSNTERLINCGVNKNNGRDKYVKWVLFESERSSYRSH